VAVEFAGEACLLIVAPVEEMIIFEAPPLLPLKREFGGELARSIAK
jgi:hypothetical protein